MAWASGGLQVDQGPVEALRAMGASASAVRALQQRLDEKAAVAAVDVFPENWHAINVFLGMGTQWRITPRGFGRDFFEGLDYGAMGPVLAEHRRIRHRQPMDVLMPQLRTLEAAARTVLNAE